MQIATQLPQWEGREPERASSDHNLSISIGAKLYVIAHLGRSTRLLESKIGQRCLCSLNHAWRSAKHNLGVGPRSWELFLHERLCGISRSVAVVFADGSDDLEHWGDAGSASEHAYSLAQTALVSHSSFGSTELDFVAELEVGEVSSSEEAVGIALDDEFQFSEIVVI
ncbi:hypothetical protein HG530_000529 [Fusarium avenaceum]|nr:hypothetical protein HG530_000529 [Fusarium avenaceum]